MVSNSIYICQLDYIDQIIHREVVQCHPRYWNEDHITYSWLRKLISEWPSINLNPHPSFSVRWDAYKMDGTLEQENGDVAFLIDINFENGNSLQGVGFLEAKRVYDTGRFDAIKWAQLRFLSANSSSHHLLLYDHNPVSTQYSLAPCPCHSLVPHCEGGLVCCCAPSRVSSAIVMPTLHAIAYEEKGRKLESIGYRLSEQIVLRYFRGLDLNYDPELVRRVLSGAAGGAKFLAVATINIGDVENASGEFRGKKPIEPDADSGYRHLAVDGRSEA